ncbi:MAG: hypothetical protein CL816_01310 [Coxiellaceae bacterium]|nr:hypothetical protein [Coxiellaceae bacterium]
MHHLFSRYSHPIYSALWHIGHGQVDMAIRYLETIDNSNPVAYVDAQILLGRLYTERNQLTAAEACFQQIPIDHPLYVDCLIDLAHVYIVSRDIHNAITCYEQVPKSCPQYIDVQLLLGELYIESDQHQLAQQTLFYLLFIMMQSNHYEKKSTAIQHLMTLEKQTLSPTSNEPCVSMTYIQPPLIDDLNRLHQCYRSGVIENSRKDPCIADFPETYKLFSDIPEFSRFHLLGKLECTSINKRYEIRQAELFKRPEVTQVTPEITNTDSETSSTPTPPSMADRSPL